MTRNEIFLSPPHSNARWGVPPAWVTRLPTRVGRGLRRKYWKNWVVWHDQLGYRSMVDRAAGAVWQIHSSASLRPAGGPHRPHRQLEEECNSAAPDRRVMPSERDGVMFSMKCTKVRGTQQRAPNPFIIFHCKEIITEAFNNTYGQCNAKYAVLRTSPSSDCYIWICFWFIKLNQSTNRAKNIIHHFINFSQAKDKQGSNSILMYETNP